MESTVRPALLTVNDAAAALRVSPGLTRRLIAAGTLPSLRLGRLIKVRSVDLDALVAGTVHATGPVGGVATP